jgi:hypothetical protein
VKTSQKFPREDYENKSRRRRNRIDAFERHRRRSPPLSALSLRVSSQRRRSEHGSAQRCWTWERKKLEFPFGAGSGNSPIWCRSCLTNRVWRIVDLGLEV